MLAIIGSTDITKHIVADSYNIDAADVYEEWLDGNYRKHREVVRSRVSGSFSVICSEKTGFSKKQFLDLLDAATNNKVLTIVLHVNNQDNAVVNPDNDIKAISSFFSLKTKTHTDTVDIFEISLEEC